MLNQKEFVGTKNRPGFSSQQKKQPMLEVLNLFSTETPDDIHLRKLQFHRFQDAESVGVVSGLPFTNVNYHIHVYGEVNKSYPKGEIILSGFMNHLKKLGYFKKVQLLQKMINAESGLFEFELIAVV